MLRVLAAALVCLIFMSCEDKNDDKVFSAQKCLDVANQGTVDTCVAMLAGVTNAQSFVIRCAADFIRQGIDTPAIVAAVEDLDKVNDGQNATVTLLNAFNFEAIGGSTDVQMADAVVANCQSTGSSVLAALGLLAKTATILTNLNATITSIDPNAVSADDKAGVGNLAISMFPLACGNGGSFADSDVCTDLGAAMAGGQTPEQIGEQFINALKNTH